MMGPPRGQPGLLPVQPRMGGIMGPQQAPQQQRKPNLLDRILGLYGADPASHIPQEQRGSALSRGLREAGIATAMAGGRGHDSLTTGQALATFLGTMQGTGARMGAENKDRTTQALLDKLASGEMNKEQLQAIFGQLIAAGRVDEARSVAEVLKSMQGQERNRPNLQRMEYALPGSTQALMGSYDPASGRIYDQQGALVPDARPKPPAAPAEKPDWYHINMISDDFERAAKAGGIQEIADFYATGTRGYAQQSAFGDVAMIQAVARMMDPNSVVRQSEFAAWADRAGLPQMAEKALTKATEEGVLLTPDQRDELYDLMNNIAQDRRAAFQPTVDKYTKRVAGVGVDPAQVIVDPFQYSMGPYEDRTFSPGGGQEPATPTPGGADVNPFDDPSVN